jgi:glycosyltransferase involved in cell wall biosynthesis
MLSPRIRVLKFLTHFGVGGTERQFLYTTAGLDRSRFDVRVACLAQKGPFIKDVQTLNAPISEYRIRNMWGYHALRQRVRFARDVRQESIHGVHAYGFYPNVFAILPAKLGTNAIAIASVRDMGVFSDRHKLKKWSQATACRVADCVIANSDAVRKWLIDQGLGRCDIRVIPNGIVVPPLSVRSSSPRRSEFNIDPKAPVVAVFGRIVRTKGVEFFLEAAASLSARYPSVRFLIVGGACLEPQYGLELEKRANELNLTGRIQFTGERRDVGEIMREVDISVLPSLSESFSNVLLESMANGLPVIATNVGGNPEIVEDGVNGLLVAPRNSEALHRAMVQLMEAPELARRLGAAAREKVTREYSLDRLLRRTEDLYVSLLERRGLHVYNAAESAHS